MTHDVQQLTQLACVSHKIIKQVNSVLRPFQYLCTSLIIDGAHQVVIISEHGLFAKQQQMPFCNRYQWSPLADILNIIDLPLEQGHMSLAMLTADDANIAEIVEVAALKNIHLLLVPFDIQEAYKVDYCSLARAAENKICIIAASREKNFSGGLSCNGFITDNAINAPRANTKCKNKVKAVKSTGLIANMSPLILLY